MTATLQPGRWRGLQTSSTDDAIFTILAFDQRGSYQKMLPSGTSYETAVQIKTEIVGALSPYTSAVLLDPDYGLLPAAKMSGRSGLLFSVEKSGYSGDATYRRTEFDPTWDVAKIKGVGASAVKLMVYYHPHAGELTEELEAMTAQVRDMCHHYDLPLYLEPMSYSLNKDISKESAEFAATRAQVVQDTAERLSKLKPDVLKLEFPVDVAFEHDRDVWRATCERVSEVSSVPWVLLSAGVNFETFAEQTRIACQSGASGFLAGRAIWKEATTMTPEARAAFLAGKAVERTQQLVEIASAHARPWTDFYQPRAFSTGWYSDYTSP